MLGLPASVKAPAQAETSGCAVAQLIAPWLKVFSGPPFTAFRASLCMFYLYEDIRSLYNTSIGLAQGAGKALF